MFRIVSGRLLYRWAGVKFSLLLDRMDLANWSIFSNTNISLSIFPSTSLQYFQLCPNSWSDHSISSLGGTTFTRQTKHRRTIVFRFAIGFTVFPSFIHNIEEFLFQGFRLERLVFRVDETLNKETVLPGFFRMHKNSSWRGLKRYLLGHVWNTPKLVHQGGSNISSYDMKGS